jgi:hypothetical protein
MKMVYGLSDGHVIREEIFGAYHTCQAEHLLHDIQLCEALLGKIFATINPTAA